MPAPELAEEWNDSGRAVTFKLRKNATFHDGAPITAKDVKWSLDRAMAAGGNPRFQLSTGSLIRPEQNVVVDDHTFRIDCDRHDPQLLPNLAFSNTNVLNSELIKKNADGDRSLGVRMVEEQSGRRRRLPDRQSQLGFDQLHPFR